MRVRFRVTVTGHLAISSGLPYAVGCVMVLMNRSCRAGVVPRQDGSTGGKVGTCLRRGCSEEGCLILTLALQN